MLQAEVMNEKNMEMLAQQEEAHLMEQSQWHALEQQLQGKLTALQQEYTQQQVCFPVLDASLYHCIVEDSKINTCICSWCCLYKALNCLGLCY